MDFHKALVTGCAGFIGSNLVDRLLTQGITVVGIDNLSTGRIQFLDLALKNRNFTFIQGNLTDLDFCLDSVKNIDVVFHFSANADVRDGVNDTQRDLTQNTLVTYNILESMRINCVKKIIFSSTGSIYGDPSMIPTPEDAPFPIQTSLYGASKLACEGLINAYCEGFNFQSWIFRFVSILGERYTHGHVYDFYKNLLRDPSKLTVLGDGKQCKSYLYVHDCIDAIFLATKRSENKINIFNLGIDGHCEVNNSIDWICDELNLKPILNYTGGKRGWIGDNPFIYLDVSKIKKIGWTPKCTIEDGIRKTVNFLKENKWVFDDK